jgi:hypothetical protein
MHLPYGGYDNGTLYLCLINVNSKVRPFTFVIGVSGERNRAIRNLQIIWEGTQHRFIYNRVAR